MANAVQSQNLPRRKPTQAELLAVLDYDPIAGMLIWRARKAGRFNFPGGKIAGALRPNGYRHVQIGEYKFYEHCIIWCMKTGEWPPSPLDHKNTIRNDNRWENLRLATNRQNQYNRRSRSSVAKGVERVPSGFRARIRVDGKKISLGNFKSLDDAKKAYAEAAVKYHGEFARLS